MNRNTQELTRIVFARLHARTFNGSTCAHPTDVGGVKSLLKAIYAHGHTLDLSLIQELAIENKWESSVTSFVLEKATHIANGGRVVIQHNADWGEHVYERIINGDYD